MIEITALKEVEASWGEETYTFTDEMEQLCL